MADQNPLEIHRFIQLTTNQPLEQPVIAIWYQCVQKHAPSGVVTVVQSNDQDKGPKIIQLIHRVIERRHGYLVPLSRDLNDAEVKTIVKAFAKLIDLDFDVETNATKLIAQEHDELPAKVAKQAIHSMTVAKKQHEDWVRKRTDDGWRYGTTFNPTSKTHPLIRPWDQLPAQFQKPK